MAKLPILGAAAAGAAGGHAAARQTRQQPTVRPSVLEQARGWAADNQRPLMVGGGLLAGGLIARQLLSARRRRQEQQQFEQELQQILGKTATEKRAMPALLAAGGRFALRGSGLMRGAANRRLHSAVGGSPALRALQQNAQQQGVRGPSLLNPLNLLTPFRTYAARRTAAGRTGWAADQAARNSRAWRRMTSGMDPVQARAAARRLTRTQIAGPGGQRMAASAALQAANPGLLAGSVVPIAGYEAAFRTPGLLFGDHSASAAAQQPQRSAPMRAVQGVGAAIGDNPIGNWVQNNPGLATTAGLAAAGVGAYGAYRGLNG